MTDRDLKNLMHIILDIDPRTELSKRLLGSESEEG